jgi:hypothetical protein
METPTLINFSCGTKLPKPQQEGTKLLSPNPTSSLSRLPQQTSSCSISRGSKWSRTQKRFCAQREKEIPPNFYRRFLELKAQAPEVLDDQVIAQAIKALFTGPRHSHLVRERPKIVSEVCEQFTKFSKSEIQHFRKLELQRKVSKPDETPRQHYYENR